MIWSALQHMLAADDTPSIHVHVLFPRLLLQPFQFQLFISIQLYRFNIYFLIAYVANIDLVTYCW